MNNVKKQHHDRFIHKLTIQDCELWNFFTVLHLILIIKFFHCTSLNFYCNNKIAMPIHVRQGFVM